MAKTKVINGYTLNQPGRKEPWADDEYILLKEFAEKQAPKGSTLATTQHVHDRLHDSENALRFQFNASGAVFNDSGADYDFRMEGDTDANLFYLNAAQDNIGIGIDPNTNAKLHIWGSDAGAIAVTADTQLLIEHALAPRIQLSTGVGGFCWIQFGDTGAANRGYIVYDHGNDIMQIGVNSTAMLRINQYGLGVNAIPSNTTARFCVDQSNDAAAVPVMQLDQADVDDAFINFIGNDSTGDVSISSSSNGGDSSAQAIAGPRTTHWTHVRMIKTEYNGTPCHVAAYTYAE